jgi:transcription elongation GreA/GreB family factor
MNLKSALIQEIQSHLAQELSGLLPEVESAHQQGVNPSAATSQRVQELQKQLTQYRFMPVREFSQNDVVCAGCLVGLELHGRTALYYLVPQGGGLVLSLNGMPVQVITDQSPLGEALMGKRLGEQVQVVIRDQTRSYKITSIV